MCHNHTTKRKLNRFHERYLRIIYNDKQSSFEEDFEKGDSVSIHDRNIQYLAVEKYRVRNSCLHFLSVICIYIYIYVHIFKHINSHPYNLRHDFQFSRPLVKTVFHGTERISYLGPII